MLRPEVPSWPRVGEQFVKPGPAQFGEIENIAGLKFAEVDASDHLAVNQQHRVIAHQ